MQHCNLLGTGYCMSCGGLDIPEQCGLCGDSIGDFDEYHEMDDDYVLCTRCYEDYMSDDEEEDYEYGALVSARGIGRKIRDHRRWASRQGCPEGIGAEAGA